MRWTTKSKKIFHMTLNRTIEVIFDLKRDKEIEEQGRDQDYKNVAN